MKRVTHSIRTLHYAIASMGVVACAGCQGDRVQSALHPAGPAAESVAALWWVLLAVLGGYSLVVFVLTAVAITRRSPANDEGSSRGRRFIMVGGVILPGLILAPLLTYSVSTTQSLRMRDGGLTIDVIGHRWWWEVEYGEFGIVSANELYIPVGEPVRLSMTSADVIHSFWVPQLHGKADMIPGRVTEFWIEADRPGVYRGQCAEYCGLQHAHMAFEVIAVSKDEFVQWLEDHAGVGDGSVTRDSSELVRRGRELYFRHGCAACHAIAGSESKGVAGPDLTWIGDRKTLAAATVPSTHENLTRWLTDPQSIKPGANMPPTHAPEEEIDAIVAYLESRTAYRSTQGDGQ